MSTPETFSKKRKGVRRKKPYPIYQERSYRRGRPPLREPKYSMTTFVPRSKEAPQFLVDENIPIEVAYDLRREGYNATHIKEVFPRGTKDPVIRRFATKRNMVIISKDKGADLEPVHAGDRLRIRGDISKDQVSEEVFTRVRQMGW